MKKNLVIIACLFIIAILLIYILKTDLRENPSKSSVASTNQLQSKSQVSKEQESETAGVIIPAEKQQLIGMKTTPVAYKPMHKTIRTVGRIEYDETRLVTVNIKLEGWIEKLYANYAGKYVKKGEPLAEIYSPELVTTQEQYIRVVNWNNEKMSRLFKERTVEFPFSDRYASVGKMTAWETDLLVSTARQRLRFWDMTEEQIKKIEETGEPIKNLTLDSPVSGHIIQKPALAGARIAPGDKLFDIADLSTVWVIADVFAYDLPFIGIKQKAKISLSYYPGKEFFSKVDYVYPTLSDETKTVRVRFTVPNLKGILKPQMLTDVSIEVEIGKKLAIPESAIINTGKSKIVYVDKGEGYFEPREVTLGIEANGSAEVISGVREGERVASSATFLIDSESKLQGVRQ